MEKMVDLVERASTTILERTTEHLEDLQSPEIVERATELLKMPPAPAKTVQVRNAPARLALKCPECKQILFERECKNNQRVCPRCHYHFRLRAHERIELLVDAGSFTEMDADMVSADPLHFRSTSQIYAEKLAQERENVGLNDAVVIGHATVEGRRLALAIMDFHFIGGSMGSVVGEKITRAAELALSRRIPLLVASASGGARMQEGLYSLMQMAKTSAALAKLREAGIPYISLLTNPTTGGVTASFAMLGDVILAEPGGLICFAGPRVIEQFMHAKLPAGAASAEFMLQHGLIDMVVPRHELRATLGQLLRFYS